MSQPAAAATANDSGMRAKLVYDGGEVLIPEEMGAPRGDQMQGTPAEQLSELAGRICYDSLGKGRPSFTKSCEACGGDGYYKGARLGDEPCPDCKGEGKFEGYHDHILSVEHGSVLEHFNFTVEMNFGTSPIDDNRKMLVAWQCMNRPGVLVIPVQKPRGIRIAVNLRSVLEWSNWTREFYGTDNDQFGLDKSLAACLRHHAYNLAPHIADIRPGHDMKDAWPEIQFSRVAKPITDHERWVSLYLSGSRGFSHEQVRHGDFTAISQRSTRYVDESESPWVEHPLIRLFLNDSNAGSLQQDTIGMRSDQSIKQGCETYDSIVSHLEPWLISRGVDKGTARKQARGAARGYLGNALKTEMIFSASVAQWRRMLRQRCSDFADAEIRVIYAQVLSELKRSRYADRFADMELRPAKDGIGMALAD